MISLALHNYYDANSAFPVHWTGDPSASWRVEILPYIEERKLYDEYDFQKAWNIDTNAAIARREMMTYQCPSDRFRLSPEGFCYTAYAALVGENTIWQADSTLKFEDIIDGTSNTILLVEACGQRIVWSEPRDVMLNETELMINAPGQAVGQSAGAMSSFHPAGVNVSFADGSVKRLSLDTGPDVLKQLATANQSDNATNF